MPARLLPPIIARRKWRSKKFRKQKCVFGLKLASTRGYRPPPALICQFQSTPPILSVVGSGRADKSQVWGMVETPLGRFAIPLSDAADVEVAICW